MTAQTKNFLITTASVAVSTLIIAALLRAVDVRAVIHTIRAARRETLIISCLISLGINIFLGTAKWKRIIAALGCTVSFKETLMIRSGCLPLKLILPLKTHEILKIAYLARRKNISVARAAHSLVLDKALNLLTLAGIMLVGTIIAPLPMPKLIPFIALLGMAALIFFTRPYDILVRYVKCLLPRYTRHVEELASGMREIPAKEKAILAGYSLVYQSSEFLNTYLLMTAVGCFVPFSQILVFIPFVMLAGALPMTILGMGTREGLMIFLFAAYAPAATLMSAGILVSLVEHLLPVIFGLIFLFPFIRGLSSVTRTHKDKPQ
ncbi:MAG: lysylphosphatidylglycerol synthase transmembrane domain-containing protein [Candidatus Omnitrophota bacterium]